jgi:ring-1,2-phenylacetyl-CoA epoxidase subunit PaaD
MTQVSAAEVEERVGAVTDPEIPTLAIADLGIVRDVTVDESAGSVVVRITPTYSGCPAMDVIARDIVDAAADVGYAATVQTVYSPPWTTDWLTERGRAALAQLDIAPPGARAEAHGHSGPVAVTIGRAPHTDAVGSAGSQESVSCPRCGSADTELIARFGTTACKALHRCRACGDPFDEFKAV